MIRAGAGSLAIVAAIVLVTISATPSASQVHEWTAFGELAQPRSFARVVALPSGEILVVGGLDPKDPQVTNESVELIDPLSTKMTLLPQRLLGRLHQSVTLTAKERVVMAGGVEWQGDHWSPIDRVEIFDPVSRSWYAAAPMLVARSDHAAVALIDGRVMAIGGNQGVKLLDSVEIYDPRTNAWTPGPHLPRLRTQHAAVTLRDGRVLVVGGIDANGGPTDATFLYEPSANTWSEGPHMTMPRLQQATVVLPNGDVMLAGGDDAAASSSEVYLAHENRFVASGSLVNPRLVAQIAALPDGRVVLVGGLPPTMTAYRPLASTEIWDPITRTWRALSRVAEGRAWGTLIRVGHALYLVSGNGSDEAAFRSVERLPID
jgi:N-acetylneuraminic acid mutarotase